MHDLVRRLALLLPLLAGPVAAEEQLHRHFDDRPPVNVKQAVMNGIQRYESQRLILYTDIDPDKARKLVTLVDQVYPTWEVQLGRFPEALDKSEFQITGYLMVDEEKFRKANLLPKRAATILHGQNQGYEFWMFDQAWDYYREHLLLHEATHCVTQCSETDNDQRPLWFLEGMAEYFGTHQLRDNAATGKPVLQFGVIPVSAVAAHGFGRIELIRDECQAGRALSAAEVLLLGQREFSESRTTPYAWSWALCHFLATHPATTADFRNVCQQWDTTSFRLSFQRFWVKHKAVITSDWELFRDSLCYGFDLPRGATARVESTPLEKGISREIKVLADRGWQGTGGTVQAGQTIRISATGRVVLANTVKPWESEPAGISIRYSEGQPIGRLRAAVLRTTPNESGAIQHWDFLDVGTATELKIPSAGALFLRVNDRWNELADNSGEYTVTVTVQD